MTMIKALFFDIDGTLVPFGSPMIPDRVVAVLNRVRGNGVKIFIASGRHPEWMGNVSNFDFDGYVAVNGGLCLLADKKTVIYKKTIPTDDVRRLVEFEKTTPFPMLTVPVEGGIFINRIDHNVTRVAEMLHVSDLTIKPLDNALSLDVAQFIGFLSPEDESSSGIFTSALTDCIATRWCPWFADIIPRDSDKSVGIDRMISHFGIDLSETMAFGDGGNDIGMLRHVALGVAMGNAAPEVKASADFVTTDVTDNGVENALRHFRLI